MAQFTLANLPEVQVEQVADESTLFEPVAAYCSSSYFSC